MRAVWRRLTSILSREGAAPRLSGFSFFRAPVGADFWCKNMGGHPPHGLGHGGFQYQVVPQFMGRLPQRRTDDEWEYTLALAAREES